MNEPEIELTEPGRNRQVVHHIESKEVMNITEAAEFLTISPAYLYRMINQGVVPCARLGKRAVFLKSCLIDWLKQQVSYDADVVV